MSNRSVMLGHFFKWSFLKKMFSHYFVRVAVGTWSGGGDGQGVLDLCWRRDGGKVSYARCPRPR